MVIDSIQSDPRVCPNIGKCSQAQAQLPQVADYLRAMCESRGTLPGNWSQLLSVKMPSDLAANVCEPGLHQEPYDVAKCIAAILFNDWAHTGPAAFCLGGVCRAASLGEVRLGGLPRDGAL